MSGQLFVVVALIIVSVAAIAGASYVFAITAEPERDPEPGTRQRAGSAK